MDIIEVGNASCNISAIEQAGVSASILNKCKSLSHVYVPIEFRRKGEATKLLTKITKDADEAQISLLCNPKPDDDTDISLHNLVNFYKRFGFIELQKEPLLMVRVAIPTWFFDKIKNGNQ